MSRHCSASTGLWVGPGVILKPHPSERLDGSNLTQPRRRVSSIDRSQEQQSIRTDECRQDQTLVFAFGESIILKPWAIALQPIGMAIGQHPVWECDSQAIERLPHSGTDTFYTVERAHGGQHMGRVSPLTTTGAEQPKVAEFAQERLEQKVFSLALEQPSAKLAQHRGIKAGILKWEGEEIFPIDARAHRIGGVLITETLGKLEDSDQREPGRILGGPTLIGAVVSRLHMHIMTCALARAGLPTSYSP